MEEWKQIQNLPVDFYYVSNKGRIKTNDHYDCMGRYKSGHIVKQSFDRYGYKRICFQLKVDDKIQYYNRLVHRLVAEEFILNPKGFNQINHIDGNKEHNNVENLEWCNAKYNVKHAYINNLRPTGEITRQARFSNSEVLEIRNMLANGISQAKIAKYFNCPYSTIKNIARKRSWNYLE